MIQQILQLFTLTQEQEILIASFVPAERADEWDRGTNVMNAIKSSITTQLNEIQREKCCYCGLQMWETGRGEIEHIAPKAARGKSYPQFSFEKQNLALACEYCNGSSKKGETDVVLTEHAVYNQCTFKLVHPYFDNPDDHYEWINEETKVVITHRTPKGKYSIDLFELHDLAEARAKQQMFERKKAPLKVDDALFQRFRQIIAEDE